MLKAITTVAAGVLLALSSQPLMAVGFGRLVNATTLGQSLDVTVALGADITEQITPDCVSADVVVGDSVLPHPAVRVRLEPPGSSGARSLRVTTTVRIHEPIVNVTVTVACPSRVSRQFVVLVDPPLTAYEPGIAVATEPTAAAPVPAPAPVTAASAVSAAAWSEPVTPRGDDAAAGSAAPARLPESTTPPSTRRAAKSSASKAASAKASVARRSQVAARKARRASPVSARATPRLELERGSGAPSAATVAAAASAAVESAAALPASAASAAVPIDAERTAELQREAIQSLQLRLDKLQSESEASAKSIVQLQARLHDAETSRSAGWSSYALTAAGAVLLLWIGLRIGRRASASPPGSPWWNADAGPAPAGPIDADTPAKPAFVPSALAGLPEAVEMSDDTPTTDPVPLVITRVSPPPELPRPEPDSGATTAAAASAVAADSVSTPASPLTADELIDLDQQAEFFVALGQDDSAVDLLNAFLRGSGGASPLPYLKLLEIHRRREERDAYERIRERHERRFGASAPKWTDEPVAGGAIEDHAALMRQIESIWADPCKAMSLIESLLVSRDGSVDSLDLSALADLQFLYLLARSAREFDEVPAAATVDLLLPLSHRDEPHSVLAAARRSRPESGAGDAGVDSAFSTAADIDLELDFVSTPSDPKPLP